jgi:hypothetical protein
MSFFLFGQSDIFYILNINNIYMKVDYNHLITFILIFMITQYFFMTIE